jgi:hypothetical protein
MGAGVAGAARQHPGTHPSSQFQNNANLISGMLLMLGAGALVNFFPS